MPKGKIWNHPDYGKVFVFHCPGCQHGHMITFEGPNEVGARWGFNEDEENPTITPSILAHYGEEKRCHSFVTNGIINFLDDSNYHTLRGNHIIPEWD